MDIVSKIVPCPGLYFLLVSSYDESYVLYVHIRRSTFHRGVAGHLFVHQSHSIVRTVAASVSNSPPSLNRSKEVWLLGPA